MNVNIQTNYYTKKKLTTRGVCVCVCERERERERERLRKTQNIFISSILIDIKDSRRTYIEPQIY